MDKEAQLDLKGAKEKRARAETSRKEEGSGGEARPPTMPNAEW